MNGPLAGALADSAVYHTVLLHAIGVGVTPMLSSFFYLAREVVGLNDLHRPSKAPLLKQLVFTWVTGNAEHLEYVLSLALPLLEWVAQTIDALAAAPFEHSGSQLLVQSELPVIRFVAMLRQGGKPAPSQFAPAALDSEAHQAFSSRLWCAAGGPVDAVVDRRHRLPRPASSGGRSARASAPRAPPAAGTQPDAGAADAEDAADPALPPSLNLLRRRRWDLSERVEVDCREYSDGGTAIGTAYQPFVRRLYGDPSSSPDDPALTLYCGRHGLQGWLTEWKAQAEDAGRDVDFASESF